MEIAIIVKDYVDSCKEREPIFVKDVEVPIEYTNARDITFFRLEKDKKIKRYKKGIYYKPKVTMFGEVGIDTEQLILKQYIKKDDKINGYLTGPVVWNNWDITTQVPNRTWIATNLTKRNTEKEDLKVKLITPKTNINNDNYKILQLLDVIDQSHQIQDINWDNYIEVLFDKLEKFDIDALRYLMNLTKYYNKFVNNFIGALVEERFKNTKKYNQLYQQLCTLKIKAGTGRKYKLTCKEKLSNANEWGFY